MAVGTTATAIRAMETTTMEISIVAEVIIVALDKMVATIPMGTRHIPLNIIHAF